MLRKSSLPIIGLATVLSFMSTTPPKAQITITGGLDKGTKELIERLPDDVAKALLQAIQSALPLIDKSVASYLEQVNKILSDNINKGATAVQCAAVGSATIIQKETATSLANMIYTGRRVGLNNPNIGNYTQDLSDSITATRSHITAKTEATEILVAYSDLLLRAAIIKCAGGLNPALVQTSLDAETQRIAPPALEWNILIGDLDRPYCKAVPACISQRRHDIDVYLNNADPRDKDVALQIRDSIPADPAIPRSWNPLAKPPIQILDYETILMDLRAVERAVEAQKSERLKNAKALWDSAVAARDNALLQAKNNQDNLNGPRANDVDASNAIVRASGMISKSREAIDQATQAAALDPSMKPNADVLTKAMNDNIGHGNRIVAQAKAMEVQWQRAAIKAVVQGHFGLHVF
jgi:hypothetical protein